MKNRERNAASSGVDGSILWLCAVCEATATTHQPPVKMTRRASQRRKKRSERDTETETTTTQQKGEEVGDGASQREA